MGYLATGEIFENLLQLKHKMIDAIWCVLMYYFDQINS